MIRRPIRLGLKAGLVLCLCTVLHAQQSPADLAKAIQNSIAGKPLMLRNFSADGATAYRYQDGHLQSGPPILHAFAAFIADKVEAEQDMLVITGSGTALVRDARTQDLKLTPARWKARLNVDLSGMPTGVPAGTIIGDLFSPGLRASLAEVPD